MLDPDLSREDQYIQFPLWKSVERCSREASQIIEQALQAASSISKSSPSSSFSSSAAAAAAASTAPKKQTFKDFYIEQLTKEFKPEIKKIGPNKLSHIVDCMESGMDMFDSLERKMLTQPEQYY